MHKITIDGLDWTSKEEIEINGIRYVKSSKTPVQDTCEAEIFAIQPCYGQDSQEFLKITLRNKLGINKMPINSKMMRPGDKITIVRGKLK